MHTYWFDVIVGGEITDDLSEKLFEAGCDDGTISRRNGVWKVAFARESKSLEDAMTSAIANVRSVGLSITEVSITEDDFANTFQETA